MGVIIFLTNRLNLTHKARHLLCITLLLHLSTKATPVCGQFTSSVMPNKEMIKTRNQLDSDADAVQSIITAATIELRSVYRPIKTNVQNKDEKPINIVATIKGNVVGLAEFLICEKNVLVRGLAVSPIHRRQGVAMAMFEHVKLRAQKEGKIELVLGTIKETGNVSAFLHMGFSITSEEVSETYENTKREPVTLVNMRKMV